MDAERALLSRPCIWNEALRIVNEEGLRAFSKGNMVTIAHRLPYTAVTSTRMSSTKKWLAAKVNTEYRKQQWNCSCRCMVALCRRWNVRNNSCYRNISFRSHQDTVAFSISHVENEQLIDDLEELEEGELRERLTDTGRWKYSIPSDRPTWIFACNWFELVMNLMIR
ncbi:putative mitochondrial carrier domain superfamily [Helianthus debilis subsp. tardiflorus]